jgi:hypothetical protein
MDSCSQPDSSIAPEENIVNTNSPEHPPHAREVDSKPKRSSSSESDRENMVSTRRNESTRSAEHPSVKYIRREESGQSPLRGKGSLKSSSFRQSPGRDALRKSFRRMRSTSLSYPHHDSIVSAFVEKPDLPCVVDEKQGK